MKTSQVIPLDVTNDGTTTTLVGAAGDYIRIGDAATTTHSLASEDDLHITGKLEVDGAVYMDSTLEVTGGITGAVSAGDDVASVYGSGSDVSILYETADANAKALVIGLPHTTEDANNVPVAVFGDLDIVNVDLGLFNGITQPCIAVVDADRDAYIRIGHNADDRPYIGGSTYISIGDAAATSQGLSTEDDLLVTGKLEVDANCYLDNKLYMGKDKDFRIGGPAGVRITWETEDSNANALYVALPDGGGASDVPVIVIGDTSIAGQDLAKFHGITEPTVAIMNSGKSACLRLDAGDSATSGVGLYFDPYTDEDVNILKIDVTGTPTIIWDESADAIASTHGIAIADDALFRLGTDSDHVALNRSTTLAADTALTGVIVGTPDTSALAANSLIISNTTTDGDILIACSDGGNSKQMLFLDGSSGVTHIGKPATPTYATATGDVLLGSKLEVKGSTYIQDPLYVYGRIEMNADNVALSLGASQDFQIFYLTSDADAKCALFTIDESDDAGNNVPVFAFGELTNAYGNLGFFDAVTEPAVAVLNLAGDAYVSLDAGDQAGTEHGLYFKPAADEDVTLLKVGVTGTPTVTWDESEDHFALTKGVGLGENEVRLTNAMSGDHTYSGITTTGTAGYGTTAIGDLVYLASADGKWEKTDADAEATASPMLAMVLTAVAEDATVLLLLQGFLRDDGFSLTNDGAALYVSTTLGGITETAPSGSGDIVRKIGYVSDASASTIYFNPSTDYAEVA